MITADGGVLALPLAQGWLDVASGVYVSRLAGKNIWCIAVRSTVTPANLRSTEQLSVAHDDSQKFN